MTKFSTSIESTKKLCGDGATWRQAGDGRAVTHQRMASSEFQQLFEIIKTLQDLCIPCKEQKIV